VKILFLCSSLEAGRDGVGDYTRRLAVELKGLGQEVALIALNDRHLNLSQSAVSAEDQGIPLLRLSSSSGWGTRVRAAREFVHGFDADILSLQFVPFGFESKGLVRRLARDLSAISDGRPWHVMCHELWIDQTFPVPLKHVLLGMMQRPLLAHFFRGLRPARVHTQIEYYRAMLKAISVESGLLPLFGNIPVSCSKADARAWLRQRIGAGESDVLAGFFGDLVPSLDERQVTALLSEYSRGQQRLFVTRAGRLSQQGEAVWSRLENLLGAQAQTCNLGVLCQDDVARYLSGLDIGLTTYPRELCGKSGAAAAMLEHGVAVRILGSMRKRPRTVSTEVIPATEAVSAKDTARKLVADLANIEETT